MNERERARDGNDSSPRAARSAHKTTGEWQSDGKGSLLRAGKTPLDIVGMVARGEEVDLERDLPSNLARAGLDRRRPNFGLQSASLMPGRKDCDLVNVRFELTLAEDRGRIDSLVTNERYEFESKWGLSWVRKHPLKDDYVLPEDGDWLELERPGAPGETRLFQVCEAGYLPKRSSMWMTLRYVGKKGK